MSQLEQYRQAMTELGAADEVALIDQRVETLWAKAVSAVRPVLDERTAASLPPAVTPDLSAPAGLDVGAHLAELERFIDGDTSESPLRAWDSPRRLGGVWLAACVLVAIVLGVTVRGVAVIPAVVPAIFTALLLLALGPGRVPGWVWAIGIMPLAVLLASGAPPASTSPISVAPQWFLGVIFVLLVHGFARVMHAADEQRLQKLANKGKAITAAMVTASARRPLEVEVVACMIGAATGPDAALLILASGFALFRRRAWTCGLAAAAGVVIFLVNAETGDWAHLIVLVAFIAHWIRAMISDAWKRPLARTELIMSVAGRLGASAVRATQQALPAPNWSMPTSSAAPAPAVQPKYPEGQFGRYCNSCFGVTAHVSAGLSMPQCVQCGSKAAGGGRGDRTFQDYCASCTGSTPHTSHGCVVCAG